MVLKVVVFMSHFDSIFGLNWALWNFRVAVRSSRIFRMVCFGCFCMLYALFVTLGCILIL
jgi:hypothetical protein